MKNNIVIIYLNDNLIIILDSRKKLISDESLINELNFF
jgi:hypothetical protein